MAPTPRKFEAPAWIEGVMCTLAVAAAGDLLDLGAGNLAPAVFLGIFFALFAMLRAKIVRNVVSAVCGAIGSVAAFVDLSDAAACSGANLPLILAWGALVVIVAGFAGLHVVLLRRGNPRVLPLALFGALETLAFFVLPFGISLDQTTSPMLAFVVSLLAAVLVGAIVGCASEFGLFIFALGIAAAMLGVQTTVGSCTAGPNIWGIGATAGFLVVYVLTRIVMGMFRRS